MDNFSLLPVDLIVKQLHELNPDGIPKYGWMHTHKKQVQENVKRWQKAHPERTMEIRRPSEARRRARKKNAAGSFTRKEWENLVVIHNHRCAYCKRKTKLTVDHVVPLSKGGTNYIDNILPACLKCNSSKGNRFKDSQSVLNFPSV